MIKISIRHADKNKCSQLCSFYRDYDLDDEGEAVNKYCSQGLGRNGIPGPNCPRPEDYVLFPKKDLYELKIIYEEIFKEL